LQKKHAPAYNQNHAPAYNQNIQATYTPEQSTKTKTNSKHNGYHGIIMGWLNSI
jgi:hypothetical protein